MNEAARDWDLWRSFLAVAREGTLSGAARALGLTQPTVGRHVDALETAIGATLFSRSNAGLVPTPLAVSLIGHAETMATAADSLLRAASGERDEARGTVRVTASEAVGTFVLPPLLADLREIYPEIEIELALSDRNENLLRREADIAVRMVRPEQEAIVARHVGAVRIGLFAHRTYVERHGLPQSVDELLKRPLIGVDRDETLLSGLNFAGRSLSPSVFSFRCDSDAARMMALKAGYGIGGCHLGLAADDPDLVPVLPETIEFGYEMWVAMHEDLRDSRRVRVVFDHLVEGLTAYARRR